MNKLVCIAGMPGSGKSVASDYFVKKGFQYLRFGQITLDELVRRKLVVSEANERKIREDFRKKYGMAAYAILNLPKFRSMLKKGNVIGDGLYSFEEYKVLKNEFKKRFVTVAIYSSPEVRYGRLAVRKSTTKDKDLRYRSIPKKDAESRDYAEIEKLNKGGTIAMADYTVVNTKNLQYFNNQLDEIYDEVEDHEEIKKSK
jgi:dephospho-CoA kinase